MHTVTLIIVCVPMTDFNRFITERNNGFRVQFYVKRLFCTSTAENIIFKKKKKNGVFRLITRYNYSTIPLPEKKHRKKKINDDDVYRKGVRFLCSTVGIANR